MATNPEIGHENLATADEIGGHRTRRATVTGARGEDKLRRRQHRILDLFGTIDYEPDYDHRAQRTRA